jgi:hypothetical protein
MMYIQTSLDLYNVGQILLFPVRFVMVMLLLLTIVSLRTAIVIDDWKLDNQQTSHNDILDSFRLSLCNYEPLNNL